VKVAPREGVTPRCALCHDDAAEGPLQCPACHTVVHAECRVGLPCPTLGCPHGPRGPVRERVVVLRPSAREVLSEAVDEAVSTVRRALPRELLVAALVVAGLAGAVVGVNLAAGRTTLHSDEGRVRADMRAIGDAADLFRIARGNYPATIEPLGHQGFLRVPDPLDPWGQPYLLESDGRTVEVLSAGRDGRFGTADDLSSRALSGRQQ
jgi:hypothetical protein